MTTAIANELNIANIHQHAVMVAESATNKFIDEKLGGEDHWPCGFAWVKVTGVKGNTKLGKALKSLGFKPAYDGGMDLWNPSASPVQNVDAKVEGAEAYAQILRQFGLNAMAQSRWD